METTVKEAGPFERMLTLRLDESELDDAKSAAARKLSKELKIKGFRPGKAPRAIVERMVGPEKLRSEAIDEALPKLVGTALGETELEPVTTPRVEDIRDADGAVEVDVRITLWPTVDRIPVLEGRKVLVDVPDTTDEEVDQQIDRLREQFAELEEVARPADTGDYVMINLSATSGGEPLEDVSADDLLYEVGSQSFIPGLDELLVGASAGDIREGPARLPEGFEAAGREVTLRVLVKGVRAKKLPEVTDEWVSDVSEFDTVDELRAALRENASLMKLNIAYGQFRERLLADLTDELDIEVPEALVEAEMESSLHNLAHSLESQGLDFANYFRITGQDQQQFLDELRERSLRALRTRILLEGVAEAEGIEVGEDEIVAAATEMAASSGRAPAELLEAIRTSGQEHVLAGDILRRKALERVLESAEAIDDEGETVDFGPLEAASETSGEVTGSQESEPTADTTDEPDPSGVASADESASGVDPPEEPEDKPEEEDAE